ncbi:MAG: PrsW family intramembrane metalloprotease [Thermoplasmata archaeon]|nr:MAG: PrsW family intramembrane metalloprotease [Thermoplasmata archaeon]
MPLFGKTSPEEMILEIVIVILLAFMPSIIYMVALRYVEKYDREPWGSMGTVFLWGATMGVVAVILVRGIFRVHFGDRYPDLATDRETVELILACCITPIIAEIIKPLGLLFVKYDIEESEDGLIYGAVSGLGYAATENLLYGIFLVSIYGIEFYIFVIIIRSISVVLLNASTSALTGYGVSRATAVKHKVGKIYAFPLFLGAAIGIHSLFNYLMVSGVGISDITSVSTSFAFAISISIGFMAWIYLKIYRLDRLDAPKHDDEYEYEDDEDHWPEHDIHPSDRPGVHAGHHPRHHGHGHGMPQHRAHPDDYYQRRHEPRPHPGMHPPPHHHAHASGHPPQHAPMHPPQPDYHRGAPRGHPPPAHPVSHRPAPQSRPPPQHHPPPHRPPVAHADSRWAPPRRAPDPSPRPSPPPSSPRRPPKKLEEDEYEADWEEPVSARPPPSRAKPKRRAEPGPDWEEDDWEYTPPDEEDSVDWEEAPAKPSKPSKPPKSRKKDMKIEWGQDEDDGIVPPSRPKGKKKDMKENEWWFDND